MKKLMILTGLILSWVSFSSPNELYQEKMYCAERIGKKSVNRLLHRNRMRNRLAFPNKGGLFDIGVCWWHSRFQRNAAYLALFQPKLDKPGEDEVRKLIRDIRYGDRVVEIPGYTNLYDFSRKYSKLIQEELENWQHYDTFILQQWVKGISGKTEVLAKDLKKIMHSLYLSVNEGNIVFQKLQLVGPIAHSWLVIDMKEHPKKDGYELFVVDSNFPTSTRLYSYKFGDTSLSYYKLRFQSISRVSSFIKRLLKKLNFSSKSKSFIPYTENKGEQQQLKKVVDDFCHNVPPLLNNF